MALYFLSYDLITKADYPKLYDELQKFKALKIFESLWTFKYAESNSENLKNHFGEFIESKDGVLVTEVTAWAGRNTLNDPNKLI